MQSLGHAKRWIVGHHNGQARVSLDHLPQVRRQGAALGKNDPV